MEEDTNISYMVKYILFLTSLAPGCCLCTVHNSVLYCTEDHGVDGGRFFHLNPKI